MNARALLAVPSAALALVLATPLHGADTTRLVPIVLDVTSGSARYTTELALTNRGATGVTAKLRYHPSLGATGGGSAALSLTAGQQLVLPDVIAYLRHEGLGLPDDEPQAGTLEVAFSGAQSEDVVAATARTGSAVASPEGRAGLAYGALREGSTSRLTVYGLRESASDRSNLAFLSTSADPVTVKVTVRSGSGDGKSVVLREAESLPPFGWIQIGRVLSEAGLTNGWAEIERVAGSGSFSAYGVVNDNVTNDGSFLPSVPDGRIGSRLTVPVVAETANLASELVLANRASSPVTLTLSYVRSLTAPDGGDGTTTLTLAPREQRILPDALSFLRGAGVPVGPAGETHVGSLRISVSGAPTPTGAPLDQVFAAARTGFKSGAGSFGLFTPAVSPAEEAADEVVLYGLRADETNRTNVAVVNSGPDAAGPVTLELRTYDGDASGVEKGSPIRQTLAPGQHAQVNLILGDAGIRNGWVRARRVDGAAPWLAYGVVNDGGVPGQRTGDGAYVAMEIPRALAAPPGTIGAAGGTLSLPDGSATLVVPAGALAAPVALTLTRQANAPLDAYLDAGSLVDLAPAGTAFAFPARLTLHFDPSRAPAGVPDRRLGVHRLDGTVWTPAASPAVGPAPETVSGETSVVGTYGVRRLPSAAPCLAPQHRQLDFWLGSWTFTGGGFAPGSNVITRDPEGCVIDEDFTSGGGRGRSVSLYDEETGKWYQTYVDNSGNRLVVAGAFEGGRMVLYQNPSSRYFWKALDPDHVQFALEASTNGGRTWFLTSFDTLYTRR